LCAFLNVACLSLEKSLVFLTLKILQDEMPENLRVAGLLRVLEEIELVRCSSGGSQSIEG